MNEEQFAMVYIRHIETKVKDLTLDVMHKEVKIALLEAELEQTLLLQKELIAENVKLNEQLLHGGAEVERKDP